jgi:hypothetical protein
LVAHSPTWLAERTGCNGRAARRRLLTGASVSNRRAEEAHV